jgi:hypothetical protein
MQKLSIRAIRISDVGRKGDTLSQPFPAAIYSCQIHPVQLLNRKLSSSFLRRSAQRIPPSPILNPQSSITNPLIRSSFVFFEKRNLFPQNEYPFTIPYSLITNYLIPNYLIT